ncbi:MAG TPA: hypothetical protein DDY31_10060, partial [Lachnospiraceae bacterium]|nr:hypothetical protein [Lachnospiraceae bacterium]
HGKKFYKKDEILNVEFDYIIIAVQDRRTTWEIRECLISYYGISGEKIIPFSIYAKSEIVENIIVERKRVDGVILGNSHACYGYLPDYLDGEFINLACPKQDIYCSCKAFQRFMEKNNSAIEYIVFDLWDYN